MTARNNINNSLLEKLKDVEPVYKVEVQRVLQLLVEK
jgi:hypothetical protein